MFGVPVHVALAHARANTRSSNNSVYVARKSCRDGARQDNLTSTNKYKRCVTAHMRQQ